MTQEDRRALDLMLTAATHAVSADNGQPWRFRWRHSQLLVLFDPAQTRSFFDWAGNATYFAVGSVLENISIAAVEAGYEAKIQLFPTDGESHVVAAVRFRRNTPRHHPLYAPLRERITNRRPYDTRPVSADAAIALANVTKDSPDFQTKFLGDKDSLRELANLTAHADGVRFDFSSEEIHKDFFRCLRLTDAEAATSKDGLWVKCLEAGTSGSLALRLLANWRWASIANRLGVGRLFAAQSVQLLKRTPLAVLILSKETPSDSPSGDTTHHRQTTFLQAGWLCQRMWLTATAQGLACQPLAVLPLFFAQYRQYGRKGFPGDSGSIIERVSRDFYKYFQLHPEDQLLMVFRMGYAAPPSARSFRRDLQDMLIIEDNTGMTPMGACGEPDKSLLL